MTTIAYRDEVLAVDSRIIFSNHIIDREDASKFLITNDFALVLAGPENIEVIISDYIKSVDFRSLLMKNVARIDAGLPFFEGILIFENRLYNIYNMSVGKEDETYIAIQELKRDWFYAYGSGAPFALGAMSFGASAREAVEIASQFDVSTNSNIKMINIDDHTTVLQD